MLEVLPVSVTRHRYTKSDLEQVRQGVKGSATWRYETIQKQQAAAQVP